MISFSSLPIKFLVVLLALEIVHAQFCNTTLAANTYLSNNANLPPQGLPKVYYHCLPNGWWNSGGNMKLADYSICIQFGALQPTGTDVNYCFLTFNANSSVSTLTPFNSTMQLGLGSRICLSMIYVSQVFGGNFQNNVLSLYCTSSNYVCHYMLEWNLELTNMTLVGEATWKSLNLGRLDNITFNSNTQVPGTQWTPQLAPYYHFPRNCFVFYRAYNFLQSDASTAIILLVQNDYEQIVNRLTIQGTHYPIVMSSQTPYSYIDLRAGFQSLSASNTTWTIQPYFNIEPGYGSSYLPIYINYYTIEFAWCYNLTCAVNPLPTPSPTPAPTLAPTSAFPTSAPTSASPTPSTSPTTTSVPSPSSMAPTPSPVTYASSSSASSATTLLNIDGKDSIDRLNWYFFSFLFFVLVWAL
jgi:hypothetical protein